MTVLVTGGAGYIGSHTVHALRDHGEDVVVLDSMEFGHRAAIGDTPLIEGDIADEPLLTRAFANYNIDAVIHFAAYKAPGESMARPERYFANNVCGSLALIRASVDAGIKHLVFSSTCAVYGTPATLPITEENPLNPENPYAESKLIVEQMLKWFDVTHKLRSVSLRYFNAAGATLDGSNGEDPSAVINLIPVAMQVALGHRSTLQVFGTDYPTPDGTAIRDYIHVLDLADAHVKALDFLRTQQRFEVFNLGTGKGASVNEVVAMVRRVSGVDFPVDYCGRRAGDPAASWSDSTKAQAMLGWKPKYDLEEMVQSAWTWYSTHPEGFRSSNP
jgi:UDP-glucose 4-epimerase